MSWRQRLSQQIIDAINNENTAAVQTLLHRYGPTQLLIDSIPNAAIWNKHSPLVYAIRLYRDSSPIPQNVKNMFRVLTSIMHANQLNQFEYLSSTPLMHAALLKDEGLRRQVIRDLLRRGADVNVQSFVNEDDEFETAFTFYALENLEEGAVPDMETVRLLMPTEPNVATPVACLYFDNPHMVAALRIMIRKTHMDINEKLSLKEYMDTCPFSDLLENDAELWKTMVSEKITLLARELNLQHVIPQVCQSIFCNATLVQTLLASLPPSQSSQQELVDTIRNYIDKPRNDMINHLWPDIVRVLCARITDPDAFTSLFLRAVEKLDRSMVAVLLPFAASHLNKKQLLTRLKSSYRHDNTRVNQLVRLLQRQWPTPSA